jgi:hypothetical protein
MKERRRLSPYGAREEYEEWEFGEFSIWEREDGTLVTGWAPKPQNVPSVSHYIPGWPKKNEKT